MSKKYLTSFKNYTRQIDGINKLKKIIDNLATKKHNSEKIFAIYKKEASITGEM